MATYQDTLSTLQSLMDLSAKSTKYSDTGMKCMNCRHYINSYYHSQNCMTVNMFETKTQLLDLNFKNMMTYGLGGCIAGFVVYKENDNIKIWMSHHPDKMIFKINLFKLLSKHTENIIRVVIRCEGHYVKNKHNDMYHEEAKDNNEFIEILDFFSCCYSIEPYLESSKSSTSVFIKFDDGKLYYTNTFGNYEKINLFDYKN